MIESGVLDLGWIQDDSSTFDLMIVQGKLDLQ
jgi:hypothetical protein